jgi:hypothetical protein
MVELFLISLGGDVFASPKLNSGLRIESQVFATLTARTDFLRVSITWHQGTAK